MLNGLGKFNFWSHLVFWSVFKWLGCPVFKHYLKPDDLASNLFLTIHVPDTSNIRIPTVSRAYFTNRTLRQLSYKQEPFFFLSLNDHQLSMQWFLLISNDDFIKDVKKLPSKIFHRNILMVLEQFPCLW